MRGPIETLRDTAKLLTTNLFWTHFSETARAFALALTLAVCGGISLGVWLGFHRLSSELFVPMLIGFASIPKVVLYPLVLLAFGLGFPAKVAFGAMFGIPPIALSTIGAVANIRPVLIKLGRGVLGPNSPLTKSMDAPSAQQRNPAGRRCDLFVRRGVSGAILNVTSRGPSRILSTAC